MTVESIPSSWRRRVFSPWALLAIGGVALLVANAVRFYYDLQVPTGLSTGFETRRFEDKYFVSNARLRGILLTDQWPGPGSRDPAMLLTGHTILEGDRAVLLWRQYTQPPYEDADHYEMLTIELEAPRTGKVFSLPSDQGRGFYSSGSSVWGGGWYSEIPSGTVRIDGWPGDGSAVVTMELSIELTDPNANNLSAQKKSIVGFKKTLRLSEITRDKLTPWLNGQLSFRPNSEQ